MNVFLEIGDGVEVATKDAIAFTDSLIATAKGELKAALTPRALIALAILAGAVGEAVIETAAAASADGLNVTLDATAAQDIVKCWPDLTAWINTLAIRPATKGTS